MKLIAEVESETGVPRATLRIWERRYGFPAPHRDQRGERVYPPDQVLRLQRVRLLMERGHRPGNLVGLGLGELDQLCAPTAGAAPTAGTKAPRRAPASLAPSLLHCLRSQDTTGLERLLQSRLTRLGLAGFVGETVKLNAAVGQWWREGQLQIHEEHLYTDCLQTVLRLAISQVKVPRRPEAPRVLLATLPQEFHGLGLLMAQALFALQGCPVVQLGVRVPAQQIGAACASCRADLVGLTMAAHHSPLQLARDLGELRGLLAPAVRIWVGGASAAADRLRLPGLRAVPDITRIADLLAEDFALAPLS